MLGTVLPAGAEPIDSVAYIRVTFPDPVTQQPSFEEGSGVLVTDDGYILTARHVVASALDGGGNITVIFGGQVRHRISGG